MFSCIAAVLAGRKRENWDVSVVSQVLMCYHPNKQIGNSQQAGHGRIITPSFHLSSILMTERDKQSVNAPGICMITYCMLAKACTLLMCTQIETVNINKCMYSTFV